MLAGCVPETAPSTCTEAEQAVDWESFGAGFVSNYCRTCHSAATADRRGAPVGMDFDSEAQTLAWSERIRARVIEQQDMPVGGGVLPEDLTGLDVWLRCTP